MRRTLHLTLLPILILLGSCALPSTNLEGRGGSGKLLAKHPTPAARSAKINSEPRGDYFIGRRYFVKKTRFWGFLRKPRQSWDSSRLVIMKESHKLNPDRLPEDGPASARYGFDQNYEYRIHGRYTGRKLYEPNSNQFLPEFLITSYELLNTDPGWLFSPNDRYNPNRITYRYRDQF